MFGGISLDTLGILWLGALLGAITAGASGFAFALAATSIWLHRIDPVHSAVLATGCGVLLHLSTLWPQRKFIEPKRLAPFIAGGLLGVPVGVYLLAYTAPNVLKAALGIFLIAFGTFVLSRPHFHRVERAGRKADAAVGFIGGILGGIGGYSGVLPTIWTQLRGWPKQIARGVYQPYIIMIQTISLVGTWIGWRIYGRMDERRFRQALAILLIASGAVLVL